MNWKRIILRALLLTLLCFLMKGCFTQRVYAANYVVTVQCRNGSSSGTLLRTERYTCASGQSLTITAPSITGYTTNTPTVSTGKVTSSKTITIIYQPLTYTLTVRYIYEDGTEALPSSVRSLKHGYQTDFNAPEIPGYLPDPRMVSSGAMTGNKTITVIYRPINPVLTIHYQYPDGTEAAPTYAETLQKGASYNIPSPEVEGYVPDKPTVSGTMPVNDQTIMVIYNPRPYALTILYQYEDGTGAAPSHSSQVPNGTPYSVPSPTIAGYLPDKETVSDTMPPFDDTVTVTYIENPARLTVGMYYEDGEEITSPVSDLITIGGSFEFTPPIFGDYEPDIAKIEDRMPEEGASYAVMYSARAASSAGKPGLSAALLNDPVINPYASKTGPNYLGYSPDGRYLYLCNNSTRTLDGWKYDSGYGSLYLDPKGGSYDICRFEWKNGQWVLYDRIPSYKYGTVASQGISCGPAGGGGSTPSNLYTLTVIYRYKNGATAATTKTQQVASGKNYSVASPTVAGHTPDKPTVSGTMPSSNKTEIVTYTPNKYTLTINYRYQNGSQAAPSYTGQFDYNAKYSIKSPVIKDYDCNAPTVTGNMPAQNKTVTVTYTQHKYILTIRYLFSDGKTAATPYVVTLVSGSPFNVKSPDVTGYTPDKAVVTGTMSSADKTLAVYYTPNKYKLTINYRYADGRQAAPSYNGQVAYNATYSVKSPTIAGYAPDIETVTGKMPAYDKTVTVTYGSSNYKLTIRYQFEDGTEAAPTYTGNFNSGASYSINSPSVTDFEPYPAVVSGTMPAYDREITVLYKVKKYWLNIYYHAPLGGVPYHKQTFAPGEEYSIPSIVVAGYTADKPLVSGTMPKNDVDVHVWYTKDGDSSSGGGTTPDINVDTDGDGKPDTNIDTDGDGKPDINIDKDGDGKPDINVDTDGDGKPDINIDKDGDGKPDINVDTDGDGKPDINIDTDGDGEPDKNVDTDGDGKPDKNVDSGGSGGGSGGNCNCGCGGGSCGSGGNSCGCCGGHCGGGGSGLDGFNWENLIHKPGEAPDIDMPSGGYLPNGIEDDFGISQPEEPSFGDLDWRVLYPGGYEGAEWDFKDTESYPETSLPKFPRAKAGDVPDGEDILDGMAKLEGSGDYSLDHYMSMYDEKWFN